MEKIILVDKIMDFVKNNGNACDRALERMAIDVDRLAKQRVPVKDGHLASSGHFTKLGLMSYKVEFNKVYAAFQEFGGDMTRRVRKYTTPGTGKFYLRDAGKEISKRAIDYIKQEIHNVRV